LPESFEFDSLFIQNSLRAAPINRTPWRQGTPDARRLSFAKSTFISAFTPPPEPRTLIRKDNQIKTFLAMKLTTQHVLY
jgi:hypothetical protein